MALRRRLPSLALTAASVGGLAWLVVAQHDQLGRAIAGIGHARARLIVAAIVCERVSMFSLVVTCCSCGRRDRRRAASA